MTRTFIVSDSSKTEADQRQEPKPTPEEGAVVAGDAGQSTTAGESPDASGSTSAQPVQSGRQSTEAAPARSGETRPDATSDKKTGGGSGSSDRRGGGTGLLWVLVVLLIGAVGFLGWQHWLQLQGDGVVRDSSSPEIQAHLSALDEGLATTRRDLESRLAAAEQRAETREQDLRDRLRDQEGRLNDITRTEREDWLLTEADYLVRLASQRLLVDRDTQVAIGLLESADELLRELDETEFYRVREAIADDLTALRLAERVDRSGLYLRIESVQNAVSELPLERHEHRLGQRVDVQPDSPATDDPEAPWWRRSLGGLHNAWAHLDNYIRIYRRDEPLQPLLSPDEEGYLRLNLRLMLEQAQLALLQQEGEVYATSLAKANTWLDDYFVRDERTRALQDELEALAERTVVPSVPELSASTSAMRDALRARPQAGQRGSRR